MNLKCFYLEGGLMTVHFWNDVEAAYRKSPILQIFPKFPNHWLIYFYKNI